MRASALASADRLKAVFAYKTGADGFPLETLEKKGVSVFNSHVNSDVIAEYAFSLAVALVNRITEFDLNMRQGIWYDEVTPYWKNVFSLKIGLFGYGCVGKAVHEILLKNNIETYTVDRGHEYHNIKTVENLTELAKKCDLIICSVPKTASTDRLFDKTIFDLMKGKYLVNVGRSNVVNQKDLYDYLASRYLGGAAIDTWDEKPLNAKTRLMPSKYPFEKLNNIILSPHAAMRIEGGHEKYVADVTENVCAYLSGGEVRNRISCPRGY